jgi:purine catabolism regulator
MDSPGSTLADLLRDGQLGLDLRAGSSASLGRAVLGGQIIDSPEPARFLSRDWLLLTTGSLVPDDPDQQRRWVQDLCEAGAAGVGLATGPEAFDPAVTTALLEEATRLELPVFTLPSGTSFSDVVAAIHRSSSGDEAPSARLLSMQRVLMDALGEPNPGAAVLERLAELIDAVVGRVTAGGHVVACTATLPEPELADALHGQSAPSVELETSVGAGFAIPINDPAQVERHWLVVINPGRRRTLHALARPAARATAPLLAAIGHLERAQYLQELAIRRAIVDGLLSAPERQDQSILAARATACGLDITAGVVAVAAADPFGRISLEKILESTARRFYHRGIPLLSSVRGSYWVGLVAAPITDALLTDELLSTGASLRVGVGRTVTSAGHVSQSWSDARLAIRKGERRATSRIIRYDHLDLATVLVNEIPVDRLKLKIDAWLVPLHANPIILEALTTYLRLDLDVARSARALHLHPNSVRYRLQRAEELIGAPLRSSSTIAALYVILFTDQEGIEDWPAATDA